MKVSIDQEKCVSCGACVAGCPQVFEVKDDGTVDVKEEYKGKDIPVEAQQCAKEASEMCPSMAIKIEE